MKVCRLHAMHRLRGCGCALLQMRAVNQAGYTGNHCLLGGVLGHSAESPFRLDASWAARFAHVAHANLSHCSPLPRPSPCLPFAATHLHDDLVHVLRHQRCRIAVLGVCVLEHELHRLRETFERVLVQVGCGNARSENGVVGMRGRQRGSRLRSKLVQLAGADALVDAAGDLLGHQDGVAKVGVEAIAQLADACSNLVEMDLLSAAISLDNCAVRRSMFEACWCRRANRQGRRGA
eukprot:366520-Chlamydomonas_euryale.AAC.5